MSEERSPAGRRAFVLTLIASVWSVVLIGVAVTVPVYGSATVVGENGIHALFVVSVPAVISAAVWSALRRKCTRGGRVSEYAASTLVLLLAAFCVLGLASIGLFVAPAAVLLAWAASITPSPSGPALPSR